MLRSMTGYGKSSGVAGNYDVEVEIKSLNNRFLDINFRLPKELYSREFELRKQIKEMITRGKITVSVTLKLRDFSANSSSLDVTALSQISELLNIISKTTGINENPKLEHYLYLKELFLENITNIDDKTFAEIMEIVNVALKKMIEMRVVEGKQLEKDFRNRLTFIEKKISEIEAELMTDVKNYFEKLKERAKKLLTEFSQYDDRLKLELALLAEKYDTSEEIVRLRSHIKQFNDFLDLPNEAGKKINFILQEMNREANTIGSKAVSTKISYSALAIKEELEKMREQIQNVE